MDEYVIGFVNDDAVFQELTFRGVSERVATGLARGLSAAGFELVTLTGARPTVISIEGGS